MNEGRGGVALARGFEMPMYSRVCMLWALLDLALLVVLAREGLGEVGDAALSGDAVRLHVDVDDVGRRAPARREHRWMLMGGPVARGGRRLCGRLRLCRLRQRVKCCRARGVTPWANEAVIGGAVTQPARMRDVPRARHGLGRGVDGG